VLVRRRYRGAIRGHAAGRPLEVDLDGRRALLSAEVQHTDLRLDLVHPGERCRIGGVIPLAPDVAREAAGQSPVGPREASA
jgi:hypothetical protein